MTKTISGIHADASGLEGMDVSITGLDGSVLLDYHRPDSNPGGNVTPFAKDLQNAPIPPEKMTAEQLVLAAIFKQKEMNIADATTLAKLALQRDPGYSEAHQLLGILEFNQDHFQLAAAEFQKAVDRNPYADESWYYLATCELKLGQQKQAEHNFYFIWPNSSYYGAREYQLGRMYLLRHEDAAAAQHLAGAINSNGQDMNAHLLLAMADRDLGDQTGALDELATVEKIDPADRVAQAETYFLTNDAASRKTLIDLMGAQSESAIEVSIFYSSLARWKEAAAILKMVEPPNNKDPWGTPPVYYYTLAYDVEQAGDPQAAAEFRKKAQAAAGIVERFPYRAESEAPLADAVKHDPNDTVARFNLACLLYYRGQHAEAMEQWQAINQINPSDFSARRALGLAYQEQGQLDQAIPQLQKAVDISPNDATAMNDLSNLYARNGKFDQQVALLEKAIKNSPNDDDLYEGLLDAYLLEGKFQAAQDIIDHHTFGPRHRTYRLRDEYRELKYAQGSQAFNKQDYEQALTLFPVRVESARESRHGHIRTAVDATDLLLSRTHAGRAGSETRSDAGLSEEHSRRGSAGRRRQRELESREFLYGAVTRAAWSAAASCGIAKAVSSVRTIPARLSVSQPRSQRPLSAGAHRSVPGKFSGGAQTNPAVGANRTRLHSARI